MHHPQVVEIYACVYLIENHLKYFFVIIRHNYSRHKRIICNTPGFLFCNFPPQPKTKCDPYVLEHGDEVKIGETVLSFHIHPGSDTCDGCEPGQVRAHLRLDKKDESLVGPTLSKEEKELERRKELKKIRVKYGLQVRVLNTVTCVKLCTWF